MNSVKTLLEINARLQAENDEMRDQLNELKIIKWNKGRPTVLDWNGEIWIFDPQTTHRGGNQGVKAKSKNPRQSHP